MKAVERSDRWPFEYIRATYPTRPIATEPHAGRSTGPMTLAWVVPPWKVGSGGHTTIFRLIQQMEQRGHSCSVHHFDPYGLDPRRARPGCGSVATGRIG